MNELDFSWLPPTQSHLEYTKEDERLETEAFNKVCGSCTHFISLMGEAGLCSIAENNCLCKNPKVMIDMWNNKCEKHEIKMPL